MRVPIDATPALATFNDAQPLTDAMANLVSVLINRPFNIAEGQRRQAADRRAQELHDFRIGRMRPDAPQMQRRSLAQLDKINPKDAGNRRLDKNILALRNLSGKAAGFTPTVDDLRAGNFGDMTEEEWLELMNAEGKGATAADTLRQLRGNIGQTLRQQDPEQADLTGVMQDIHEPKPVTEAAQPQAPAAEPVARAEPQRQIRRLQVPGLDRGTPLPPTLKEAFAPSRAVKDADKADLAAAKQRVRESAARFRERQRSRPGPTGKNIDPEMLAVDVRRRATERNLPLAPHVDQAIAVFDRGGDKAIPLLQELVEAWGDDQAVADILTRAKDMAIKDSRMLSSRRGVDPSRASQTYTIIRNAVAELAEGAE